MIESVGQTMEWVGHAVSLVSIVELANRLYDTLKQLAAAQAPSEVLASLTEKVSELKNEIESLKEDGPAVSKEGLESLDPQLRTVDDLLEKIQNSITCSEDRTFWQKAIDKFRRSPDISAMLNELDGLLGRLNKDISKLLTKINYRAAPKFCEYVPDLTPPPVGLDRLQPILSFLEEEEEGVEVRAAAIHGEGGLGKTTLLHWALTKLREKTNELKFVYVEFEREPDDEAIQSKQSSIIQQILEESEPVKLSSSAHGRNGIKRQLQLMMKRKRKICLAIDDVWKKEDFRKLLPNDLGSHLPPSSYILLTTRSLDVVNELNRLCKPEAAASTSTQDAASTRTQNEEKRCKILRYRPEDLSEKDARELFVRHARISPSDENIGVELADKVVELCGGHPLALEILGGYFSWKQRRKHWKDTFQRMDLTNKSLINPRTVLIGRIFRGTYNLEPDEQRAFLDVACFFDGWNWETVKAIVGFSELEKLNTLCFVKQADGADYIPGRFIKPHLFTCGKVVKMHPLLVELGRCEAQRSRVLSSVGVLKDYEESELQKIEGWWDSSGENAVGADVLERMESLRVARIAVEDAFPPLMSLTYLDLKGATASFKLLSMRRCKQLSVLTLQNIRSSFDDAQFPDSLRQLRLVNCSGLVELPSSFGRPDSMLEILHVAECSSLKRLPDTICELRRLRELVVLQCKSFVKLTTSSMLTGLAELQVLRLTDCDWLTDLPKDIWGIKSLTQVCLEYCKSLTVIIPSVSYLSSLQILSVRMVKSLELSGDCDIWKLHSLRELHLPHCKNMKSIPEEVEELKALGGLESLDLSFCKELQVLPESIGALVSLKELDLAYCEKLAKVPASIEKLSSLQMLNLRGCSQIKALPATIFTKLTDLAKLSLSGCCGKEELLTNLISLKHLSLDACDCDGLLSIVKLTALTMLSLRGCSDLLLKVPQSIAKLTGLYRLCLNECYKIERLPESIGDLFSLRSLNLACCKSLVGLPGSVGQLKGLEVLGLSGCCEILELPGSIINLSSLLKLDLSQCKKLTGLPEGFGNLGSLEYFNLEGCKELTELPAGIGKLKSLKQLNVSNCKKLTGLPEGFGNLGSLEYLNLDGCKELTELPAGIGKLKSLKELNVSNCSKLKKLPDFSEATSLVSLKLQGCENLTELPAGIGKLKSMTELDVRNCSKLKELPDLTEATSLVSLALHVRRKRAETCELEEGDVRRSAEKKQRMCDASSSK